MGLGPADLTLEGTSSLNPSGAELDSRGCSSGTSSSKSRKLNLHVIYKYK